MPLELLLEDFHTNEIARGLEHRLFDDGIKLQSRRLHGLIGRRKEFDSGTLRSFKGPGLQQASRFQFRVGGILKLRSFDGDERDHLDLDFKGPRDRIAGMNPVGEWLVDTAEGSTQIELVADHVDLGDHLQGLSDQLAVGQIETHANFFPLVHPADRDRHRHKGALGNGGVAGEHLQNADSSSGSDIGPWQQHSRDRDRTAFGAREHVDRAAHQASEESGGQANDRSGIDDALRILAVEIAEGIASQIGDNPFGCFGIFA
ncbi:MAG: hypothetical protein ACK553_00845 [Planctomycetota bacterium]